MYSGDIALENYPDWYKVERDTEKTIKRLSSVKELSFYLRNSDEAVRRLAILRVNELKLKDSLDMLKEILDDRLENAYNKELAAWTIKAVCLKWNMDVFISSKLLNKYTGSEKYNDIFKVSICDTLPSVNFNFSADLINSELQFDESSVRNSDDIVFSTHFEFSEWIRTWLKGLLTYCRNTLSCLPVNSYRALRSFIKLLSQSKPCRRKEINKVMIGGSESRNHSDSAAPTLDSLRQRDYSYLSKNSNKISLIEIFKKTLVGFLYFFFYPVRLFVKHRFFSVVCILLIYVFLTYTTAGKIFTYKNFGLDLTDIQSNAVSSVEEILSYALAEVKELAGVEQDKRHKENVPNESASLSDLPKTYRVTARTGLNLRTAPSESARKVMESLLPYNTQVAFTSKTHKDSSGRIWFFVQTKEGYSGWVYSKWLEETGGDRYDRN